MADVIIAIPTFRRPRWLERLLDAIAKLETAAQVTVLVGDNDSIAHEGHDVCQRLSASGYRWPIDAFIVAERGIAQARNALVERALAHHPAQFVAMLDDDEWPEPGWLDAFLRTQQQTGADALHGAVLRVFEQHSGSWTEHCEGLSPWRGDTGPTDMIASTSNVLLRRQCLEAMPKPWFDPAFALTGGEDRDFFTRLKQAGIRFGWADAAVVNAFVPASRGTLSWALKRAYRVGNSDMRVFLKYHSSPAEKAREIAKIAGAVLLFPLMLLILGLVPNRRAVPLAKLCRAAGKTGALFGRHYNEYATIHGH